MKEIKLTQGLSTQVDDDSFEYLNQVKWYALKNKNTFYAQRSKMVNGKKVTIKMHRLIMDTPKGLEVDHIDHNGLNNQISNLRNCTLQQNRMNKSFSKNSVSKYVGVTTCKGYIIAKIRVSGRVYFLGRYQCEEDAALAYNCAALIYHGEFANLNKIEI